MQANKIWHRVGVVLAVLSLLTVTYTTILLMNVKTPEATVAFLKNGNAFYYMSQIIKTNIRSHYSRGLRQNVIKLTTADAILNAVVSPTLIERLALPALQLRQKVAQLPLSFVENDLVISTQQYTNQINQTLASFQLPSPLVDAINNLVASIPPQITLVDSKRNPNSILVSITQTRILFEHIQTILTISWIVLLLSAAVVLISNYQLLKRLVYGFFIIFFISGIIGIIASFVIPAIATSLSSNPNPVTGVLQDELWDNITWYYFSLTQPISIVYLLLSLGFYLVYRFAPFPPQVILKKRKK